MRCWPITAPRNCPKPQPTDWGLRGSARTLVAHGNNDLPPTSLSALAVDQVAESIAVLRSPLLSSSTSAPTDLAQLTGGADIPAWFTATAGADL